MRKYLYLEAGSNAIHHRQKGQLDFFKNSIVKKLEIYIYMIWMSY